MIKEKKITDKNKHNSLRAKKLASKKLLLKYE